MQPSLEVVKQKCEISAKEAERNKAIISLKNYLRPGTTVYTVLRSVSASGMSRTLDLYVVINSEIVRITWRVAEALDARYDQKRQALRVSGCGMDMGWHCIYNLSHLILGNGYALKHQWL
jgi:hypothetical protein